jgi:hypothetical protein
MSDQNGQPPENTGGVGGLLSNPNRTISDANLIRRAISERWPVSLERRQRLVTILGQIAETDVFEIEKFETSDGGSESKGPLRTTGRITMPNHRNQIAAARTLVAMVAQNQADEHHADDDANSKAGLQLSAAQLAASMTDLQKINLYIASGRPDLIPARLRELAKKEGLIQG